MTRPGDPKQSWRTRPLPPDWQQRRARALKRDGWQCQLREPGCTVIANEVDHIIPGWAEGSDDLSNLQSVCTSCHRRKTGRDAAAARPTRRRPPEAHPGLLDRRPPGG